MSETKDGPSQKLKINDWNDLRRALQSIDGIDPDTTQSINDFIKFKNVVERTNLPTRKDVQRSMYLDFASKFFFPGIKNNPFEIALEAHSTSFMAKGGEKSKQFVEMMKQTPTLADIQTLGTPQNSSILNRLRRGGSTEE